MAGVLISRGMTVAIPAGGLTVGVDDGGKFTGSATLHVRFDVCPAWCHLALRHLEDAKAKRTARQTAWAATNEDEKAATLEREFQTSMQAIMAAAIAVDAFYSLIQTHVQLPPKLLDQWHTKRTARYTQVTEVLRRAFQLKPKGVAALRQNLKEIYRFRDLAIHPSGSIEAPILHPELNIGVEWQFAFFRAHNAELVVNAANWILWDLAHRGKAREPEIAEYMNGLRQQLDHLRHRMISEAAYYLYAQRGYADGYDLDDWLLAEAQIDQLFSAGTRRPPQAALRRELIG